MTWRRRQRIPRYTNCSLYPFCICETKRIVSSVARPLLATPPSFPKNYSEQWTRLVVSILAPLPSERRVFPVMEPQILDGAMSTASCPWYAEQETQYSSWAQWRAWQFPVPVAFASRSFLFEQYGVVFASFSCFRIRKEGLVCNPCSPNQESSVVHHHWHPLDGMRKIVSMWVRVTHWKGNMNTN